MCGYGVFTIAVANSPTIQLTARRSRKLSHPAWQFGKEALFTIIGVYLRFR